ncbi:MAG: hypothetical protein ACT4PU_03200 [Planctomycetota bacterium]
MRAHPLLAVLLVVLALFLLGIDHGLPERYLPDDHAVKCALGIARDLGNPDLERLHALVPPAGHYTTYPYLLPYTNLAAIGARYAVGRVLGEWHGGGEFAERVFQDSGLAWLPARLVTVLLTLLLPLGVYRAARELNRGRGEAALAALFAGSSLLVVQYAHAERPWAPLAGFMALTLALSLRLRRRQRLRDSAWAWIAAALCAATHPAGVLAFGLPALASLQWRLRLRGVLAGAAAGLVVALLIGYPYLLVYGRDTGQGAISGQLEPVEAVGIGGQTVDLGRFHGQLFTEVVRGWIGYDPVLVLLGGAGLLLLVRSSARGRGLKLVLLPPAFLAVVFLLYDGTHVRYLLPAAGFLALGAARAACVLAQSGRLGRLAAVFVLALPLTQAGRLDWLHCQQDTRTQAAAELVALLPPDARIAIDGYAPPLIPSAESVRALREHVWISRIEQRQLDLQAAGQAAPAAARHLFPVYRFWKHDSYHPTDYALSESPLSLEDWMAAWDIDYYLQVDRLPSEKPREPIAELMRRRGVLMYELSPTGSSPPSEAALPTEMAFALSQVWQSRRPGPWIRCWRIAEPGP